MSWNPSEITEQLGQKAGQYAASYFSKGEGGGFIAQAQHKFITEQVGGIVTTKVNEFFHIEKTGGKNNIKNDVNKPSGTGGFMGGVNQIFNKDDEGPSENHIPPSERIGQKKEGGGFMGQAKEFADKIFGGDDEANHEDHIPANNRVGQPGYQARDAYPTSQNQGGFVGENRNYAGNEPNQAYPSSGGYAGDHIPSGQRVGPTQNYVDQGQGGYYGNQQQQGNYPGMQQGYYGGQQQQGGYPGMQQQQGGYGQQYSNYP